MNVAPQQSEGTERAIANQFRRIDAYQLTQQMTTERTAANQCHQIHDHIITLSDELPDELAMDELAKDELVIDELAKDELEMDEFPIDELAMNELAMGKLDELLVDGTPCEDEVIVLVMILAILRLLCSELLT